jgi:hypothetical protein
MALDFIVKDIMHKIGIVTQSSSKGGGALLKTVRTMTADFMVTTYEP